MTTTRHAWVPYESAEQATEVLGTHEGVEYLPFRSNSTFPEDPANANFLVIPYAQRPHVMDAIDQFTRLQVIQSQMAGVDAILDRVPDGVTLANAAGVHDTATAEIALALALSRSRNLDDFARDQPSGQWNPQWGTGLADQRITIIGYGHIGKAIEARLAGFEVASITRLATRARTETVDGREVEIGVIDDLDQVLPDTDVLFIIAPLSPTTKGLIDARRLALLPDGAMVVNVGRGPIVVTDDLVQACASGRITAALDVIDPEPVPADHPLRTTLGVLFSPHVGGYSQAFYPRRDKLLREQIARWAKGEPLANVVEH